MNRAIIDHLSNADYHAELRGDNTTTKVCSDATGGQVKPRLFRVVLNAAALEYAQAVFARYAS